MKWISWELSVIRQLLVHHNQSQFLTNKKRYKTIYMIQYIKYTSWVVISVEVNVTLRDSVSLLTVSAWSTLSLAIAAISAFSSSRVESTSSLYIIYSKLYLCIELLHLMKWLVTEPGLCLWELWHSLDELWLPDKPRNYKYEQERKLDISFLVCL